MTIEDFLCAIVRDPAHAADTWLVLADWLEEQGDPRWELVRLLYQPGYSRTAEERDARYRELLDVVPPLWPNSLNAHFTWVPPGTYWMGGGGGKPGTQQVEIAEGFALGVFPVTQAQWQAVMGHNPSHFSRTHGGKDRVKSISEGDLALFPVEWVSFKEVEQFLEKLNNNEAGGWFYRLPSDAEWEYACRGGTILPEDSVFHFYLDKSSNDLSSTQANFDGNYPEGKAENGPYLERTTRVGTYRPNRLGLYDMLGNVWEWTSERYEGGLPRVIRGGCWSSFGADCRAGYRGRRAPSNRYYYLGFRLARVPRSTFG